MYDDNDYIDYDDDRQDAAAHYADECWCRELDECQQRGELAALLSYNNVVSYNNVIAELS